MKQENHATTRPEMRPELEILLSAVRGKNPESEERIRTLFAMRIDWPEVLACAIQHKVEPVLYERIRTTEAGWLGQDQRETLAELARIITRNNLLLMNEMLRLYGLFESAQILAIPFKGPALAWLAYPNFAQRTCVDLDFVVPQRQIPKAMSLLQAHGYTPQFSPMEARAGQNGPAPGEYAFVLSRTRIYVELHTERTLRYFPRPLDLSEMKSRLIALKIGGQGLRTFSVEDMLVMLCVHGAKHFWDRLGWVVDIAQLVTIRRVDWPLLLEISAEMQATRVLLLGLYLAYELIGATVPPTILERARKDTQVQRLAGKVLEQYSGKSEMAIGVLPRALFRLRCCDGYSLGLRQLFRLTMSPTESDRQLMQLPGFLSFIYGLARPVRLLKEYGLGLNRKLRPDLAIYIPTPPEIVNQMLRFADVTAEDVLYDLGCGDGRIVVAAAEKYGIRAVGVDINPTRITAARANARRHGVEKRVQFILGDAKLADFKEATIVTMYLGCDGNLRLADRLRAELRPGARIISRDFQIYGWAPERVENRVMPNGVTTSLYLWTIKDSRKDISVDKVPAQELQRTHKPVS